MSMLFIYGTLGLGGPNEHVMTGIGGQWKPARVKGDLAERGWRASMVYPGLVIRCDGDDIRGHVLDSENLDK